MSTERIIQAAIVQADIIVSGVLALPWKRIGLSLLIAAIFMKVVKDLWTTRYL